MEFVFALFGNLFVSIFFYSFVPRNRKKRKKRKEIRLITLTNILILQNRSWIRNRLKLKQEMEKTYSFFPKNKKET